MRLNFRGIIRFGILFGLNFAIWGFLRSYFNFIIGVFMLVSEALSVFFTCAYARKLRAELVFPAGFVAPAAGFNFGIEIKNPIKFMIFFTEINYTVRNIFVEEAKRQKVQIAVLPGKDAHEKYQISSNYCGVVEGKIDGFWVSDLLHLVKIKNENTKDGQVVIYPGVSGEEEEAVTDMVAGFCLEEESNNRGMDFNPDYEIREYIPGDDLKAIHWKLTAKQGKLMVRERLAAGHNKVNVVLELTLDRDVNEKLLHSLNSVCKNFLLTEFPVELYWWSYAENQMKCRLLLEEGELQSVICEILGMNAQKEEAKTRFYYEMTRGNAPYVMITAGESKGEYIRMVV